DRAHWKRKVNTVALLRLSRRARQGKVEGRLDEHLPCDPGDRRHARARLPHVLRRAALRRRLRGHVAYAAVLLAAAPQIRQFHRKTWHLLVFRFYSRRGFDFLGPQPSPGALGADAAHLAPADTGRAHENVPARPSLRSEEH